MDQATGPLWRSLAEFAGIAAVASLLLAGLDSSWLRDLRLNRTGPTIEELLQDGTRLEIIGWGLFYLLGIVVCLGLFMLLRRFLALPLWKCALAPAIAGFPLLRIAWMMGF